MVWHKKLAKSKRNIKCQSKASPTTTVPAGGETGAANSSTLASQLYAKLRAFLLISQLFVCAPLGSHWLVLKRTKCNAALVVLHLSWCFFIYATLVAFIYTEYTQSNVDLPTVQKPLFFCEYLIYLAHILQIIVTTYAGRRKYRQFLAKLLFVDRGLLDFSVEPNYQRLADFLRRHLYLILLHFLLTAICNYYYSGQMLWHFLRSITVYMVPNTILEVHLIQYYALLYAITLRSSSLNDALRAQISLAKAADGSLQRNMQCIRLLYSKLEVFTRAVNDAFGVSLVLVFVGSYVNLSFNIFLIYKYMDDWQHAEWAWIMYSVIWSFMHLGKMVMILYYNQRVQQQKTNTALLLNALPAQNAALEETIRHFILQLVIDTRSNVVCGVAILDMSFVTSLLVAISTMFIFLLQYDITYEALTRSHKSATAPIPVVR